MIEPSAFAHGQRHLDDRIVLRLPVDLRQHDVGFGFGEETASLHRRQLSRIAEHQDRLTERQKVPAQFLIHHRTFVDDDQVGLGGRALPVQHELRTSLVGFPRAVDHRMNRRSVRAALGAENERSLSRIGAERDIAIDSFGNVPRECRLPRSGISKQPEQWLVGIAKPIADGFQRGVLLG